MKRLFWLAGMLCLAVSSVAGQEIKSDSSELESFDEVLISAQRLGEKRGNSTRQIEIITASAINQAQQPTMAEVLSQTGQVFVQKSQLGGGSPVLRGFEASRVLLVVDGVRMNNATYRAGHLQDIVTIDPFMLDRTEIYFGSGSTLYGSDALGGVIYLKTKQVAFTDSLKVRPTALLRYSSAGNNITANTGWSVSSKKISWLFNYSFNRYGDLRMGRGANFSNIDTFGFRGYYVQRFNGKDSVVKNTNPYVQVGSGYDQSDFFSKLAFKHGRWVSTLNLQASVCDLVPRYDRLTQVRGGALRFAQWAYTPQNRLLGSYTAELKPADGSVHRFIVSAQSTEVGRLSRPRDGKVATTQLDKVKMLAFNYDNRYEITDKISLQSGAEWVMNVVNSKAFRDSVYNGTRYKSKESRYADSIAGSQSASVFSNVVYEVKPNDLSINAGLRLSYYKARAVFTQNNFWGIDYGSADVQNVAPVFTTGIVKKAAQDLYLSANYSTGFRNPNIDDLTKLFESIPGEKYIIPNTSLKAERTQTADFGIRYMLSNKLSIETGVYQTWIKNLLIDAPSQLNGSDSVVYNGQKTRVYQMGNAASGVVKGAYFGAKIKLIENLYSDVYYAVTRGTYKPSETANTVPLDHIAPDHGRVSLRYVKKQLRLEAYMLFNGWKTASSYSPSGEDNASQAPNGATPSWQTYNLRAWYTLKDRYQFTLAVENILDLNYRVFSSGINAPGRNFIASVRITL